MNDWVSFWDSDNPIYVNARHRDVHNRLIADAIRAHVPHAGAVVLDYGCGEALHAQRVAEAVGRLILSDAGPKLRAALERRFAGDARVEVLSPEAVARLPDGAIDLLVLNSVAQYLAPEEMDAVLATFRRLLKPEGLLLVGDVIPRDSSSMADVAALLRFAAANGFFFAAIGGLIRTVFSGYLRLRAQLKLTRYDAGEMIAKLARAGFSARRIDNLGHDRGRMTFAARPA